MSTLASDASSRRGHALPSLLLALTLTACGGGGGASDGSPVSAPLACIALPDEVSWLRSAQSSDWNDVLVDGQNRIWLAGWTDGTVGQERTDPGGNSRAVVRQLAPDGRLLWDSGGTLDSPGTDVAEALALSPQGVLYAVGRTSGALGDSGNAGQFDTFVAWSERPGGAAPWRIAQTGTERPQHPRRATVGADGDLFVVGYDDEYIIGNYVAAWADPFALRWKHGGTGGATERLALQWQHQFASAASDWADGLAVVQGPTGPAIYLSGTRGGGAQRGMFVRKLDASGQPLWTVDYGSWLDNISVLRPQPDGTLLMAGSVYGSFRGGMAQGGQDVFVARIAGDDGRVLESWQFGSAGADWLTDMQIDTAGQLVLLGETTGSIVAGQAPAGQTDLFMLKLSPQGRVLGARQWGTADDESAHRLALDSCGRAVAVGSSTGAGRRSGVLWFWQS
ncbi:MAG: hypothetical protein KGI90_12940 [Burkholderiales bacterium]|nr:hypothetical protein [Burkholderiales bacterium]MDE2276048.1 hypothetical protein [Burkholderiales bacterium]